MAPRYVARLAYPEDRGKRGSVYKLLHLVDEEGRSMRVVGGMIAFKRKVFVFAEDGDATDMIRNDISTIEQRAKFTYWGIDVDRALSRVKPYLARKAA